MIERISKILFVSDPRLFSIGALRSGVTSKRDAHCRALPIRATFHVIDKRRHHRNVQKIKRKPISIGNDANNCSMKVVLTNAMSTQCSVGMKKEKTSSTHAHAVRTKKAVLRKVVLSPTKYWRQYCNPHGGNIQNEVWHFSRSPRKSRSPTMRTQAFGDHSRANLF